MMNTEESLAGVSYRYWFMLSMLVFFVVMIFGCFVLLVAGAVVPR